MGGCYKWYIKKYGIKKGAKLWREGGKERWEKKRGPKKKKKATPLKRTMPEIAEPEKEMSLEDAKEHIKYRADKVLKVINMAGWRDFIEPLIKEKIKYYSTPQEYIQDTDTLEDIGLLFKVTNKVKQELQAILGNIEYWIIQAKELREEEKEEK